MAMIKEFRAKMVQNQESKSKLWKVIEIHNEPKLGVNLSVEREAKGCRKIEYESKEIDTVIKIDYLK